MAIRAAMVESVAWLRAMAVADMTADAMTAATVSLLTGAAGLAPAGRAAGLAAVPVEAVSAAPSPDTGEAIPAMASATRMAAGGYGRAFGGGDWRNQQNEVRQAVREGRHIPLGRAIDAVRQRSPGRELDAGLETGPGGRTMYRVRWAASDGRRIDYLVDAATGAIISTQGGR
jgi:hypothetical protein